MTNHKNAELSFGTWSALKSDLVDGRRDWDRLRSVLSSYKEAIVYIRRDHGGTLLPSFLSLWSGEVTAYHTYLKIPPRQVFGSLKTEKQPPFDMVPVRIGDHIHDEVFLDALSIRLTALSPYDPVTLPDFPDWLWYMEPYENRNLLAEDGRVIPPPGWHIQPPRFGPIWCQTSHVNLIDGQGRMGLMRDSGSIALSCRYAYLGAPNGRNFTACEAAMNELPPSLGLCDIIDTKGKVTNPPDIKVLAGTLKHGIAVAAHAQNNGRGPFGYISSAGRLMGEIRWRKVSQHWSSIAKVQDAGTKLWGHVDRQGEIIVEPRFKQTGMFNHGFAIVSLNGSKKGVIDETGGFVVNAVWQDVTSIKDGFFMVEARDSALGVVDPQGRIVIEPRLLTKEELQQIEMCGDLSDKHPFNKMLAQRLQRQIREALRSSKTLGPIAGLLRRQASDRDLLAYGLLGRKVVVVADCMVQDHLQICAGDAGIIGWQYPVSGSIFNLQQEAPVEGLSAMPHASIGVPWCMLALS